MNQMKLILNNKVLENLFNGYLNTVQKSIMWQLTTLNQIIELSSLLNLFLKDQEYYLYPKNY